MTTISAHTTSRACDNIKRARSDSITRNHSVQANTCEQTRNRDSASDT